MRRAVKAHLGRNGECFQGNIHTSVSHFQLQVCQCHFFLLSGSSKNEVMVLRLPPTVTCAVKCTR